jgi:hypothetical protein
MIVGLAPGRFNFQSRPVHNFIDSEFPVYKRPGAVGRVRGAWTSRNRDDDEIVAWIQQVPNHVPCVVSLVIK